MPLFMLCALWAIESFLAFVMVGSMLATFALLRTEAGFGWLAGVGISCVAGLAMFGFYAIGTGVGL